MTSERLEVYGLKPDEIAYLKNLAEKEKMTAGQKVREILRDYIEGRLELGLGTMVETRLTDLIITAKKENIRLIRMVEDLMAKTAVYSYLCWWAVKGNLKQPVKKELFHRAALKMRLPLDELEREENIVDTAVTETKPAEKPMFDFGRKKEEK